MFFSEAEGTAIAEATERIVSNHLQEVAVSAKRHEDVFRKNIEKDAIYDLVELLNSKEEHTALRLLGSRPIARSTDEFEELYGAVTRLFGPLCVTLSKKAVGVFRSATLAYSVHFEKEALREMRETYEKCVLEEHMRMSKRLNSRIEFLQAQLMEKSVQYANVELRGLSPHLASLLRCVSAAGLTGQLTAQQTDSATLAKLEREVTEKMRPEELAQMTGTTAKRMLAESHQRELQLWNDIDNLQALLEKAAVEEESRRKEFANRVEDSAKAATAELEERVKSLAAEVAQLKTQVSVAENERDEAGRVVQMLLELAAKLNLQNVFLVEQARLRDDKGLLDGVYAEVQKILSQSISVEGIPDVMALDPHWNSEKTKRLSAVRQMVQSALGNVPDTALSRQQHNFLKEVLDVNRVHQELRKSREVESKLRTEIGALREQLSKQRVECAKTSRGLKQNLSEECNSLRTENAYLRCALRNSTVAAAQAENVVKIRCATGPNAPLVDDLSRKLRQKEYEIKSLQADAAVGISAEHKNGSSSPTKHARPNVTQSNISASAVPLDDAWVEPDIICPLNVKRIYSTSDASGPAVTPHSARSRTPRAQQLKAAYRAVHGAVTKRTTFYPRPPLERRI